MTLHNCVRLFLLLAALLVSLFVPCALADEAKPPMEWGSISKADLAMTSYVPDTNASAVVLCDYGETELNDELDLVYNRHVRIKIFTSAGYAWGSCGITAYTDGRTEKVSRIEGVTYTFGPDSSIVESPLEEESIFEEKVDDFRTRYRFTLPGLKPGCIVEYRYRITINNLFDVHDWTFQCSIPTVWSEYRLTIPDRIIYSGVTRGYEQFYVSDFTQTLRRFSGTARAFLGGETKINCNQFRWVVRNAPAVREEPFITTTEDYCNRVILQLAEYATPDGRIQRVLKTWPTVVEELLKSKKFGKQIDESSTVEELTRKVTAGLSSPDAKMAAIYDHVRNTIVVSGPHRAFADKDPDDVLESKSGNDAEIAFLLISMLRCAGIDAHPVILSTRGNGSVQDVYPIVSQFNYVLAMATIGTIQYFLDATDPLRPLDLLPTKVLNVRGLLVKEGPIQWVVLNSSRRYVRRALAVVQLDEKGGIRGVASCTDEGYSGLARRRSLVDTKEMEYAKEVFSADRAALTLDSVLVTGKDSLTGPLTTEAQISSPTYAQASGDLLYVNPFIIDRQVSNPFTLVTRNFPVEMSYLRRITVNSNITVPDGFEVKETPRNADITVGAGLANYFRRIAVEGNMILMQSRFETNAVEFSPNIYKQLRDFYGQMIAMQGEQIVLQRRPAPAVSAAPAKKVVTKSNAKSKR